MTRAWRLRPWPLVGSALLAAVTVIVFRRQLFEHWSFPWDFVGGYSATPPFVAASVGRGHLISWLPFVASGFPPDVDPQSGVYFPVWWLLGVLHAPLTLRAVTAVQVAHVFAGAVGVTALARARRLAWPWALIAGLAYLFFGGFYGEAEHADIFRGFSYLPWLLWALTPPAPGASWTRIVAVPPVAWLIASGAYPGQIVSFAICGFVYVSAALWPSRYGIGRSIGRKVWWPLILAAISACAACLVVLIPYLHAERGHELVRILEPTASVRAGAALSLTDLLGLYLNNFAWTYDGTVTAICVGVPVLVGLACVRSRTLYRQMPLVASGVVGLLLAMTPKIAPIGRAMASIRPLFPSRFPAADYKAMIAISLIIIASDAWSEGAHRRSDRWTATTMACILLAGAMLAPTTFGHSTYRLWLLVAVLVGSVALAISRPPWRVTALVLTLLIVADGAREISDYRLLGKVSPWEAAPQAVAPYRARDVFVRKLPTVLDEKPVTRPSRVPPASSLASSPTGTDPDAAGWVADGYHMVDYGGTIERALWQAEQSPEMSALLLQPWHAFTFQCARVGCSDGRVHLPPPRTWSPSIQVQTTSYSSSGIAYTATISRPTLMVENELALRGWHASSPHVHLVNAGIPFRAWRLQPGRYQFRATYREPGRALQQWVALFAVAAWLACVWLAWRIRTLRTAPLNAAAQLPIARSALSGQVIRYALVAGSGYLLAIALYTGELALGIPAYPALGVAFVLNGIYNFSLIRIAVFPPSGRHLRSDLARFWSVAALSLVINYGSFAVLYSALALHADMSQRIAILIAAPFTFFANRIWSFRSRGRMARVQSNAELAPTASRNESYSRM